MALTSEVITANEQLAELSEDQVNALVELSKNDENVVIANKVGEIHGQYDKDIKEILGIEKPQGMKTYDWLKSEVLPKAKGTTELQTKLQQAEEKVTELSKKIEEGSGDDALKQQLKDAQTKLSLLEKTAREKEEELTNELNTTKGQVTRFQVDSQFSKDISDVKFIDEKILNSSVKNAILASAKEKVLSGLTPEITQEGIIYRYKGGDKDGQIALNPSNGLKPYTLGDLVLMEESVKGIIAQQKAGGAGGDGGDGGDGGENVFDVSEAKDQVSATAMIEKELMTRGLSRGTTKFQEEFDTIWKENKISELPMKKK